MRLSILTRGKEGTPRSARLVSQSTEPFIRFGKAFDIRNIIDCGITFFSNELSLVMGWVKRMCNRQIALQQMSSKIGHDEKVAYK